MISISMAGEVQSPSTSAKILGDWFKWYFQRYFNDVQWEVRRDGFYQLLFWVESRQFPAQTMQWTATSILLRRMVGVPSRFSCILKVKHSQNAVFGCCSVDQKVSRHHIRETAVEGSFVKIRKANLSLNKTCLLDNTSYFDWYCIYIYMIYLTWSSQTCRDYKIGSSAWWPSTQPSFCVNASGKESSTPLQPVSLFVHQKAMLKYVKKI